MPNNIEKRIRVIQGIAVNISSNLKMYYELCDKTADVLFESSPNFFAFCRGNFYAMAIIQLEMLLGENTESNQVGLRKLLNCIEGIGNKNFYKGNTVKKEVKIICEECKELLDAEQSLVKKIKNDRDKVFAHQDKKYAIDETLKPLTSPEDIKRGLSVVNEVLNKISEYFNETQYLIENFYADDIEETKIILNLYNKYYDEIEEMENRELLMKK